MQLMYKTAVYTLVNGAIAHNVLLSNFTFFIFAVFDM